MICRESAGNGSGLGGVCCRIVPGVCILSKRGVEGPTTLIILLCVWRGWKTGYDGGGGEVVTL